MWDKHLCEFPEMCAGNEARALSSVALLLPLVLLRLRLYSIHLILLTAASIWYWLSGSFASRVADGILVATLPFALLTWLSETPSALIAYGLALVGYLVLGECHSLGELANLPSWLAYLVVLVMLFRLPKEKKYLIAALLFGSGAAFLLLATAANFSKLTWCVSGFDNTALGHILTGFALFFLVLAIPTPLPVNNIELLFF